MLSTLPTDIGELDAITEAALLAGDVERDDEGTRRLALAGFVVFVALVLKGELVIEDAKKSVVGACRTEEVEVVSSVCRAAQAANGNSIRSVRRCLHGVVIGVGCFAMR